MRCTIVKPTPVPSNSPERCRRWNTWNSLPEYFMLKPVPLSRTEQTVRWASSWRDSILTLGAGFLREYGAPPRRALVSIMSSSSVDSGAWSCAAIANRLAGEHLAALAPPQLHKPTTAKTSAIFDSPFFTKPVSETAEAIMLRA
jgi:hypothetical protein